MALRNRWTELERNSLGMTDWNRFYQENRQQKRAKSHVIGAYSSAELLNGQRYGGRVLQRRICCARGGCRNGNGVGLRGLSEETPGAASGQPNYRSASEKYNEYAEECLRRPGNLRADAPAPQ